MDIKPCNILINHEKEYILNHMKIKLYDFVTFK